MINSVGLATLASREMKRTIKIINQVVWPPVISTVLYFFIFVIGLGRSIGTMDGLPYVQFLVPGLIFLNVVEASFGEGAASLFILRFTNAIQELLVAPLSYAEMVIGMIAGSVLRALLIGNLILLVGWAFGGRLPATAQAWGWYLLLLMVTAILFSSLGLIAAVFFESWDQLAIPSTFVLTPLIFVGGVFASVRGLPEPVSQVALFNPLFYLIDGMRAAITGAPTPYWHVDLAFAGTGAAVAFAGALRLFQTGYKLRP
ncbi:MAG: ABC transporter permease [Candidatus Sericytochromatia bacterium]|nr:ABC transporter permease [Candidatus Tanganyikabacteria bacterium]